MVVMTSPFAVALAEMLPMYSRDPLGVFREKAWKRFSEKGLPSRKDGAFQYFPLRSLYETSGTSPQLLPLTVDLQQHILPECQESCIVFLDGAFCQESSRLSGLKEQIVVLPMAEAFRSYGHFLQNRFHRILKEERDPFAILNLAQHQPGAFVYVPPKTELKCPIQVLYVQTQPKTFCNPRLHLFFGAHAEGALVETEAQFFEGSSVYSNRMLDLGLEEGAIVHLDALSSANNASNDWHFAAMRASLKANSRLLANYVTTGAKGWRLDLHVALMGENSEAQLKGLWMLSGRQQAHVHVLVEHEAPHCQSLQHFKGVVDENSQSSFEGKIYVHQAAQKTQAYQLNNNLILGEHAIANSKPNLEIFADDVKASHGATMTQLSAEELFYLQARGIGSEEAKGLLVNGFCRAVIDGMKTSSLRDQALSLAQRVLSN